MVAETPMLSWDLVSICYLVKDVVWLLVLMVLYPVKALLRALFIKTDVDLKGKVVLVTGSGSGIGRELCLQLSQLGCRIACVDINKQTAEETAEDIRKRTGDNTTALSFQCDVSKEPSTRQLADDVLKQFDSIDVIINNAGVIQMGTIDGLATDRIQQIIDVNLNGNFWMFRSFLPMMKKSNNAHFVTMCSVAALHCPGNGTAYSASKSGLMGLMYALDEELRANPQTQHIKLTTIYPYFIATTPTFMNEFESRVPAVNLQSGVSMMIDGICKQYFCFTVPALHSGMFFSRVPRLLPIELYHALRDVFYINIKTPQSVQTNNNK